MAFNEKIIFRQKIWIKFSYLSAICFIFFIWGFYDYSISEFNSKVIKFVDEWLGMIGAIILSIIAVGGVLPAVGLVWAILRSSCISTGKASNPINCLFKQSENLLGLRIIE